MSALLENDRAVVTGTAARQRRRIPIWLAIFAASLPMFMATLDNLVMTSALPVISRDLNAGVEQLQWFLNAYTLAFATFMLLVVALGDRFGRRRVFLVGITVFTVASALGALSTEPWMLIGARAVQGLGAAAVMPLSLTLLVESVPTRLRSLAVGIWGGVSGLGVALGPLIGGAVIEGWHWQGIFWLNVPVGIIAFPLALIALPNTFGARVRADILGVALAAIGILAVVFGIVRGNDLGWNSATIIASLAGGGVLLALFVLWESRTASPLLPLRLFRDRSFAVVNLVSLLFGFGIFGSIFILIQFMQVVQGKTPLEAGILTMPWTLAPMVIAPLTGIVAPRIGTRTLITSGMVLLTIAIAWIALVTATDTTFLQLLPPFLFAGVGMGLVFAPISTAVLANMPAADHAKASGVNSTVREIGIALGIAVLTAVFSGAGGQLTPTGYVSAAIPAITVGAGALALATVLALFLPSRRRAAASAAALAASEPADALAPAAAPAAAAAACPADCSRGTCTPAR